MTDLEMTKLCAQAMELQNILSQRTEIFGNIKKYTTETLDQSDCITYEANGCAPLIYDPLHNDAQAMALVKKFELAVWGHAHVAGEWKFHAECNYTGGGEDTLGLGHGLTHNYAIVECVAKMQAAK